MTQTTTKPNHKLRVGDILRCSWGYEQTNQDYYQVTRLAGRTMVELRRIGVDSRETGFMRGLCKPLRNRFIGGPIRRRVQQYSAVAINSYQYAFPEEPVGYRGNKPVYRAHHWSSYA